MDGGCTVNQLRGAVDFACECHRDHIAVQRRGHAGVIGAMRPLAPDQAAMIVAWSLPTPTGLSHGTTRG
jgi:hypothetical protein